MIDTSVWARLAQPAVAEEVAGAIEANAVAMVSSVLLELLRSARDARELDSLAEEYAALHQIPLTPEICVRAGEVQAALARRGYHRGPSPIDLLTAASAEAAGAALWHCDRDFELIAGVSRQPMRRLGR